VELHGGTMRIESEVGRGTTVYFSLPLPGETQSVAPARWLPGYALRISSEPSVLVLHDDLRVLPLLRRYVPGYQYQLAETAARARTIIQQALPAAVIMDTTWATRAIENSAELGLPPELLLIECPLPSARRLGAVVGAVDYIVKPVSREDLSNALARLKPPETVLVVDDEPDLVRLIERMLKADHPSLRVLEAFGGTQGLEIWRAEHPDLVLLDLVMPDMDGYAFLEQMADDPARKNTHVVIISATGLGEDDAPIAGDVHLARPAGFSLTEILRTLQVTLASITSPTVEASTSGVASPRVFPD
ncbi:MAG: response regulator, partial [Chloroflexota bacterium]